MKLRTALTILGVSAAALAAAAPTNFAQKSVPIRAAVVLLDSQKVAPGNPQPANYAPFVWHNLDSATAVKPAGWDFHNPRALGTMTQAAYDRWVALSSVVGGVVPPVGSTLTKRDAAYWELRLATASDEMLADYDVLLVAAHGRVSLNPLEREKLRRFVDKGGVLWIDMTSAAGPNAPLGTTVDPINGFPLTVVENRANLGAPSGFDPLHPLLGYPYGITPENLNAMQSSNGLGLKALNLADYGISGLGGIFAALPGEFAFFNRVAGDNLGPVLLAGQIGDGFLVVTARGVATTLNRVQTPGGFQPNLQARALDPTFDRSFTAAAKLVVNMIHLPSGSRQFRQGARKSGSSPVDVQAPLLKRFNAELALNPGDGNSVPPAVFKNLLVAVDGNRVYVFNARPGTDLDGDGIADEGMPDRTLGLRADLIWHSAALDGPISPPLCIEVPSGPFAGEQILVQEANGRIVAFRAITLDGAGRIVGSGSMAPIYTVQPPDGASVTDTSVQGRGPYAPTYHEGFVYVADTTSNNAGRIWVLNPGTGQKVSSSADWVIGKAGSPVMFTVGASPTVGYIPIADNSGGLDKVAYVVSRPNPSNATPNGTASVTSVWIGAKGERPIAFQVAGGNQLRVTLRCSQRGLSAYLPGSGNALGVRLTLLDAATGDPYSPAQMDAIFDGSVSQIAPGLLSFGIRSGASLDPNAVGVRVDYTIDWGQATASANAVRGNLFLPDNASRSRRILDAVALGPDGTIYLTFGNDTGGSLFAFREEGQGAFELVYRYDLYPQHTIPLNQASAATYRETILDKDPVVTSLLPFLNQPLTNLRFVGAPAVKGDTVYVMAKGTKLGVVPNAVLMAFKAKPGNVDIRLPAIEGGFTLLQPDLLRSTDPASPNVFTTIQPAQYRYDSFENQSRGVARMLSLMSSNRGPVTNAVSLSQPIILRRANQPDELIEPDRSGSSWSPLLWYVVFTGMDTRSAPVVLGDTVYVAGASVLPNLLSGPPFPPLAPTGIVTAINATISPNDAFLVADADRPWNRQLHQLKVGPIRGNPNWVWPQTVGVTSFDDYRVRVLQTTLGLSPEAFGVVGGDGALFAWSSQGIWGFSRADFLVCDEGRVARFDPSGNALWSTEATLSSGPSVEVGNVGNARPLVRPVRAYRFGIGDLLVVDAGANRIVRLDSTGREVRSIQGFVLDPNALPDGYRPNDPQNLRDPRDVVWWTEYKANPTGVSNPQPLEYWVHYLIADAGNHRVVELVDRYAVDPATRRLLGVVGFTDASGNQQPALGVLAWHSPSTVSGKGFRYTSLARVFRPDTNRYVFAAAIGGTTPTRVDLGLDAPNLVDPGSDVREARDGNGGIVFFDGASLEVINEVTVPAVAANVLWNPESGSFSSPAVPARKKLLGNLSSVTMQNVFLNLDGTGPRTYTAILFTDASGVYEIVKSGSEWRVVWMLPRNAYRVLRRNPATNEPAGDNPLDFRPMYAKRLDSGEILVVNGYFGRKRNGEPFEGEILQLNGDWDPGVLGGGFQFSQLNLGFSSVSVRFELPPIQGTRGLTLPVFADRD
ncbi:MAG: hypothetical protein N2109_11040 [Fimbriimonadales bacterium]|nr:hypothetical protein [Fimbriimonadales bacterium]